MANKDNTSGCPREGGDFPPAPPALQVLGGAVLGISVVKRLRDQNSE
jgi:hypothetical protein